MLKYIRIKSLGAGSGVRVTRGVFVIYCLVFLFLRTSYVFIFLDVMGKMVIFFKLFVIKNVVFFSGNGDLLKYIKIKSLGAQKADHMVVGVEALGG